MKVVPYDTYARLRDKAIAGGAEGSPMALRWALHGRCSNPYELRFQPSRSLTQGYVDLVTPCRNCQHCLRRRARFWAAKAGVEYARAERTWFATYTFGPQVRANLYAPLQGVTDAAERRARLIQASGGYLSRYLKKVRKSLSGQSLRYLAVPELHKDGTPHWHALLHTHASWRSLAKPWAYGFSKINLVEHGVREIRYVTKYLAKDKLGRVRASLSYGSKRSESIPRDERRAGDPLSLYIQKTLVSMDEETRVWFNHLIDTLGDAGYSLVPTGEHEWVIQSPTDEPQ